MASKAAAGAETTETRDEQVEGLLLDTQSAAVKKLIARGKEAQWRPCEIKAAPLKEATDWMEQYRQFWEERFDRLEEYLKELQAQEKPALVKAAPKRKKHGSGK